MYNYWCVNINEKDKYFLNNLKNIKCIYYRQILVSWSNFQNKLSNPSQNISNINESNNLIRYNLFSIAGNP